MHFLSASPLLSPPPPLLILSLSSMFFQDLKFLRRQVLDNLLPGREYCVSIRFSDPLVKRKSNYSRPVCGVAPGKQNAATGGVAGLAAAPVLIPSNH